MRYLIGLLCLVLLIIWAMFEHQALRTKPQFILSQSQPWGAWFFYFSNRFNWFSVLSDQQFGKRPFRVVYVEVTGRQMTAFEIQRTLTHICQLYGYNIKIAVSIRTAKNFDLIRIFYVTPQNWLAFKQALDYAKHLKRLKAFKDESIKKILAAVGKKK